MPALKPRIKFEWEVVGNRCKRIGPKVPEDDKRELTLVQRYRESHHSVARMFASGMTPAMIRRNTGYSQRRLTLLAADPSFQELISLYSKRLEEKWEESVDAYTDLAMGNMLRAEAQIADHLEESEASGELLPLNILDKISAGRADRFGYSKHTVIQHNHDFASLLDRAIARSGKGEAMKQIEGSVIGEARQVEAKAAQSILPDMPVLPLPQEAAVVESSLPQQPPRSFASVLEPIKRRRVA